MLKPLNKATSRHLLDKSCNNINPYVSLDAEARTKVQTLIKFLAESIFKEDEKRFVLQVHQTRFTARKSASKALRVQDLLLAEEPEKLEAMVESNKGIKLVIRFEIRSKDAAEESSCGEG